MSDLEAVACLVLMLMSSTVALGAAWAIVREEAKPGAVILLVVAAAAAWLFSIPPMWFFAAPWLPVVVGAISVSTVAMTVLAVLCQIRARLGPR